MSKPEFSVAHRAKLVVSSDARRHLLDTIHTYEKSPDRDRAGAWQDIIEYVEETINEAYEDGLYG